jgi:carboxylesterase type B
MASAIVGLLALFVSPVSSYVSAEAELNCGIARGTSDSAGISSFYGVPYALPPVAALRWQPPTLSNGSSCWSGQFDARWRNNSKICPQKGRFATNSTMMGEDCLVMHAFTGNLDKRQPLQPVFLYLHGGSLVAGSGLAIQSAFGAVKNLAAAGVVSLSINYRINVAGFLALDVLSSNDQRGVGVSGNYGLLDVIAALKFVRLNARAFGGDPDNIIVYGQSSGGSLVMALLYSPLATGLFHKAISMSGSPRLDQTLEDATEPGQGWHWEVVNRTRCANLSSTAVTVESPSATASASLLSCLYSLSAQEMVDATPDDWDPSGGWSLQVFGVIPYAPLLLIDGHALPQAYVPFDAKSASSPGPVNDVPVMIGVTREEVDFAPQDLVVQMGTDQFRDFVTASASPYYSEAFVQEMLQMYIPAANDSSEDPRHGVGNKYASVPPTDPRGLQKAYADIISDAEEYCPNLVFANYLRDTYRSSSPVYVYAVSQHPGAPFCELAPFNRHNGTSYCPLYSFHAIDMFWLFAPDKQDPSGDYRAFNYTFTPADKAFTATIRSRFVEFAKTGRVASWREFKKPPKTRAASPYSWLHDGTKYSVVDLKTEDVSIALLKQKECQLFLGGGFYNKSWIN